MATIIGIVGGVALLGYAIYSGAGGTLNELKLFANVNGIFIVLGGVLAATFISYPLKEVIRVIKVFFIVFKSEDPHTERFVNMVAEVAAVARKGITALEGAKEDVKNFFLKDGIQMIIDGYSVEEIEGILATRITNRISREGMEAKMYRSMAKFAPAFGMLGTLIGLINMMSKMAEEPEMIGPNMAIALVTTFYGVLLANLIFSPIAEKLDQRSKEDQFRLQMLSEGIILLHQRKHPLIVRDVLKSYVPPRRWKLVAAPEAEAGAGGA